MNQIFGQKAVGVNSDEGWNLIRASLKHFFLVWLKSAREGIPTMLELPSSRLWSNNSTHKKKHLLVIAGATGASLDALKCAQQQCIGWIEDHRLLHDL